MIRLIRCLRRRTDISPEQFRQFWNDPEYEEMIVQIVNATQAVSHVRNLTLQIDVNKELMEFHGTSEPYDGVVEIWWESAEALLPVINTASGAELQFRVNAFEDQFIDREASQFFITEVQ